MADRKIPRPGLAVLASVVLIPLSALAAVALTRAPAPVDAPPAPAATQAPPVPGDPAEQVQVVTDPVVASAADIDRACTADAIDLVDLETAETITALQQAALDALRQICADAGTPIPDPPPPPPVVREVRLVAAPLASSNVGADSDDEADRREVEDEEHEEHDEDEEGDD